MKSTDQLTGAPARAGAMRMRSGYEAQSQVRPCVRYPVSRATGSEAQGLTQTLIVFQWAELPEKVLAAICAVNTRVQGQGWDPETSAAVRLVCSQWQRAHDKTVPRVTPSR